LLPRSAQGAVPAPEALERAPVRVRAPEARALARVPAREALERAPPQVRVPEVLALARVPEREALEPEPGLELEQAAAGAPAPEALAAEPEALVARAAAAAKPGSSARLLATSIRSGNQPQSEMRASAPPKGRSRLPASSNPLQKPGLAEASRRAARFGS
jgi:hypothetical protein